MAGWIKLEKDLETDPRVLRMAKDLARLSACNASAFPGVTLVVGALSRIWIYADSHARDDDSLDLGCAELDEWLGIPGFCSIMPRDWLIEIDERAIELPGFHAHNGVEAKKRALTQKRVANHRTAKQRNTVTPSNASTLPDQDQTKTRLDQDSKNPTAASQPAWIDEFKSVYPRRAGSQPWPRAIAAAKARIGEGHTPDEFIDGARRYAEFVRASGKERTEFVQQAATFLGPAKPFLELWDAPATKAEIRLVSNLTAAEEFMRRTEPSNAA